MLNNLNMKMNSYNESKIRLLKVLVIGSGSWGTALALAANKKNYTFLWGRDKNQIEEMIKERENYYLPGINLPNDLNIINDIDNAFSSFGNDECIIIVSVPIAGIKNICSLLSQKISEYNITKATIIWTSKGLDPENGNLLHEIVEQNLNISWLKHGILSGPSFAREVSLGLPTALTIASKDIAVCNLVIKSLHGKEIRLYSNKDIIGVEVGGSLKNVIAIACGISDGLKLGANARSALITRGLQEMKRFGIALGADENTFLGLSCLGDLVLTSTDNLSRNRNIGIQIGQGISLQKLEESKITVEGVRCAMAIRNRSRKLNIEMPIIETVCSILFENLSPREAVSILLEREAKYENF